MVAAKNAVVAPTTATAVCVISARANSGCNRAIMYTPAVTMVAAWISAKTGVGPSIASGSQVYSGNCADLPVAPANSSSVITVTVAGGVRAGRRGGGGGRR